jgi:hypothetical protein
MFQDKKFPTQRSQNDQDDEKTSSNLRTSGSLDKHLIGLGHRFYNVQEVGEAESSLEELELFSPKLSRKSERIAAGEKFRDFGFKTILKEVPRTEEIDLSHSPTSGFYVRLHVRSRSVLVIRRHRRRHRDEFRHQRNSGI